MTFVRIDTETAYIYFENDTPTIFCYLDEAGRLHKETIMRSQYTLKTQFKCIRMTKKREIPIDKKTCVWYNKHRK